MPFLFSTFYRHRKRKQRLHNQRGPRAPHLPNAVLHAAEAGRRRAVAGAVLQRGLLQRGRRPRPAPSVHGGGAERVPGVPGVRPEASGGGLGPRGDSGSDGCRGVVVHAAGPSTQVIWVFGN